MTLFVITLDGQVTEMTSDEELFKTLEDKYEQMNSDMRCYTGDYLDYWIDEFDEEKDKEKIDMLWRWYKSDDMESRESMMKYLNERREANNTIQSISFNIEQLIKKRDELQEQIDKLLVEKEELKKK